MWPSYSGKRIFNLKDVVLTFQNSFMCTEKCMKITDCKIRKPKNYSYKQIRN